MPPTDEADTADDLEWIRSRVLNVIGHELRTPVTTVRGLADALSTSPDPAVRAKIIVALQRNTRRLERLVDDLLTAVEVRTALPVGDPKRVPLGHVTHEAWEEIRQAPDQPVVHLDVDENGTPAAFARPTAVRRILGQVLRNAVTYGTSPVTVTIRQGGDTDTVRVVVDSPGDPVPAEDLRYALQPFWRGERAVTTAPGLGLGLTIARILAEHERGTLRIAGREGGGVLTSIELPAE
jgi:two-component system sensor histidine kinase KdpD